MGNENEKDLLTTYVEKASKNLSEMRSLNSKLNKKLLNINGWFFLSMGLFVMSMTFMIRTEIEINKVDVIEFLSIENKEAFKNKKHYLLLSEDSVYTEQILMTNLEKDDLVSNKTPSFVKNFEETISQMMNVLITSIALLAVVFLFTSNYIKNKGIDYYYNVYESDREDEDEPLYRTKNGNKIGGDIYYMFSTLIVFLFFTLFFKFKIFDETTNNVFSYNLEIFFKTTIMFYIIAVIMIIPFSSLLLRKDNDFTDLKSSEIKKKAIMSENDIVFKLKEEIKKDNELVLKLNEKLEEENLSKDDATVIRNVIGEIVDKNDYREERKEEVRINREKLEKLKT